LFSGRVNTPLIQKIKIELQTLPAMAVSVASPSPVPVTSTDSVVTAVSSLAVGCSILPSAASFESLFLFCAFGSCYYEIGNILYERYKVKANRSYNEMNIEFTSI
jgi:hypothetical protein